MGLLNFLKNIFKPKPKALPEFKGDIYDTSNSTQSLSFIPKVDTKSHEIQGNNAQLEAILISKLKKENLYQICEQKDNGDNSTAFYHIFKNEPSLAETILHVDCKQKNIAILVDEILTGIKDDDIYLKFMSNQHVDKSSEDKPITIYALDKDILKILSVIDAISIQKPELFEDVDITSSALENPTSFMSIAEDAAAHNNIDLDETLENNLDDSEPTI